MGHRWCPLLLGKTDGRMSGRSRRVHGTSKYRRLRFIVPIGISSPYRKGVGNDPSVDSRAIVFYLVVL